MVALVAIMWSFIAHRFIDALARLVAAN